MLILVTGATGYIGGRLVPELLDAGYAVRCLARSPDKLRDLPWRARVEVVRGDMLDRHTLAEALEGVDAAYYLVHAMGAGGDFSGRDLKAAQNFAAAAAEAGVARIIYLGGLHQGGGTASEHMRSRNQVGRVLLEGEVPTVMLRAAVILGSGSASFEMLRYLTERLPVMTTPRWVRNRVQPVAVRDVLRLLVGALRLPPGMNRAFDVGGPEVLTYAEMIGRYARMAGLPPRVILPVPGLSPGLSSLWIGLVTPLPANLAQPLIESIRSDAVCREDDLADLLDDHERLGFEEAVRLALRRVGDAGVPTHWSSANSPTAPSDPLPTDPSWSGGALYLDERTRPVAAPGDALWRVIEGIGGDKGWYSWPLAWSARGWLDSLVGGAGLRRGRRDPHRLRVGDSLDFWRVEELDRGELLRLRAEMRLPGLAWLELRVEADGGRTRYRQRALFRPRGLVGQLYWWGLWPLHGPIFASMARNIAQEAERAARARPRPGAGG